MGKLGVSRLFGEDRYLGLPLMFGRNISKEFDSIKRKVVDRLRSWNGRLLSQQGKGVLIRSIVQAIPTFTMACFKLPMKVINELNVMVAVFWWGGKMGKKKIHWLAWDKLCLSKFDGGQGFKDLICFNQAMIAKTWWRIIHNEELLVHRILKAKYGGDFSLQNALLGNKCSFLWKSLMWGKELVDDGGYWCVGSGNSIDVWADRWLRGAQGLRPVWYGNGLPRRRMVSSLIDAQTKKWKMDDLWRWFQAEDVDRIVSLLISSFGAPDKFIWQYTSNGEYTVKSGYIAACRMRGVDRSVPEERVQQWKALWTTCVAPKVQYFFWRVLHDICPTGNRLLKRGLNVDSRCPVCHEPRETLIHSLFSCHYSRLVWGEVCPNIINLTAGLALDENFWFAWMDIVSSVGLLDVALVGLWMLWKNRNACLHDNRCDLWLVLCHKVRDFHQTYQDANRKADWDEVVGAFGVWQRPPLGWVKINVDASFVEETRTATLGVVVRDSCGEVLLCAVKAVGGVLSPLQAELLAMKYGMELGRERGWALVMLESDSLTGVRDV